MNIYTYYSNLLFIMCSQIDLDNNAVGLKVENNNPSLSGDGKNDVTDMIKLQAAEISQLRKELEIARASTSSNRPPSSCSKFGVKRKFSSSITDDHCELKYLKGLETATALDDSEDSININISSSSSSSRSSSSSSSSSEGSFEGGDEVASSQVVEDGDEIWDLRRVFEAREIRKPNAIKCDGGEGAEGECDLTACCEWKSNKSNIPWYSCLDCQYDEFGGWPEGWLPIKVLTRELREAMHKNCTRMNDLNMPKYNVLSALVAGTLTDADRDDFSKNEGNNTLDTSHLSSYQELKRKENVKEGERFVGVSTLSSSNAHLTIFGVFDFPPTDQGMELDVDGVLKRKDGIVINATMFAFFSSMAQTISRQYGIGMRDAWMAATQSVAVGNAFPYTLEYDFASKNPKEFKRKQEEKAETIKESICPR